MLVVAIDVGIKNLALCAMDSQLGVVQWANEALSDQAYQPMHNVQYVHEFIARNADLFARADKVVVERQMRVNMRIIEAVIQSRFYDKCKVVHARTIKTAFGLGRGNYTLNKKASVDFVQTHLQQFEQPHWRELFAKSKKRDDLADAYVMALFFSGGSMISKPCVAMGQGRDANLEASKTLPTSTPTSCSPCGSTLTPTATPP
jgi:hypothetical protein